MSEIENVVISIPTPKKKELQKGVKMLIKYMHTVCRNHCRAFLKYKR